MPPVELPPSPQFWARVRSVHISRNFPTTDVYQASVEFRETNGETLDSAWVQFKQTSRVTLGYDSVYHVWSVRLSASFFGDPYMETAVGWPFLFTAKSDSGEYEFGPRYLARVITGTPRVIAPANEDTVSASPLLTWEHFSAGFAFGYRATVIDPSGITGTDTVWISDLLPVTQTEIQMTDTLISAQYYWTVTVVDSFENVSRSKEGEFVVLDSSPHSFNNFPPLRGGIKGGN